MSRPPAVPTVQIDSPRLRVTEWRFPPGGATGFHRHEMDYCVVPITTGALTIDAAGRTSRADLVTGQSYARLAGVEHDVINDNPFEFIFIEVELKS